MRYRLMATYRGVPYEAGIGPTDDDVVLFAACPPPEELGFEPATGHWRKQLRVQEVQALWESRPMGTFRGEPCIVLDDLGDRLHIAYLGHDAYKAEHLGYWEVDRGVFELITPRDEVSDIVEERLDYTYRPVAQEPLAAQFAAAISGSAAAGPSRNAAATGPHLTGPHAAPPNLTGPHAAPPDPAGADVAAPDLAVIPPSSDPPLPLEAAALRAATTRVVQQVPASGAGPDPEPGPRPPRRRGSGLGRLATARIFSELAGLAAIPPSAYAVGEEVDGAMCLIQTEDGFEVFNAAAGARHEVRIFDDEESAYFYLFGILAAEAVRTGRLAPRG